MKVILLEDVDKLGKTGEVVNVSPGYARNYLLPHKRAVTETLSAKRFYEDQRKALERKAAVERGKMEEFAKTIEGTPLEMKVQVGEEGKLFGSVTAGDIAKALKEMKGLDIEKRKIGLDEPIRSLGTFEVPLRLFAGVVATVKLSIVATDTQ